MSSEGSFRVDDFKLISEIWDKVLFNKSLWLILSQIITGNNYVPNIARGLKKNASVIAKKLRILEELNLVIQREGAKKWYDVNWDFILRFWFSIYPLTDLRNLYEILGSSIPDFPSKLKELYLTEEDWDLFKSNSVGEELLEAVKRSLPLLKRLLKTYLEITLSHYESLGEALPSFSRSLFLAMRDIESEVDIRFYVKESGEKEALKGLFSKPLLLWLKLIAYLDDYGALLIRNIIIRDCLRVIREE